MNLKHLRERGGWVAIGSMWLVATSGIAGAEVLPSPVSAVSVASEADLRAAIVAMKASPKGPFEAVRWFCSDGAVLPPRPGACTERGGGLQHGVLSARAAWLREQGYAVANVLASLDPARFVGDEADLETLRHLVVERFLIRWDDGWIFRGARTYRGALQVEDEEAASERLVRSLVADPGWLEPNRFLLLREVARALPLPSRVDLAARMRTQAAELGDADPDFGSLRARIHSFPEPGDAARVRVYARTRGAADSQAYEALARTIDEFFASRAAATTLGPLVARIGGPLGAALQAELPLAKSPDPRVRFEASARALEALRRGFGGEMRPASRMAALRASLVLEAEAFASSQVVLADVLPSASRRERMALLRTLSASIYGAGLLSDRQLEELRATIGPLEAGEELSLEEWRSELGFLARAPEWSRRWLMFHFGATLERFARIEPEAGLFEPDRLRGSPLLAYSVLLDGLLRDARRLSGATDRVLGEAVGLGMRGLNPGIARGVLRRARTEQEVAALPLDSVALLAETTAQLPPVAAILTLGEGSSLSHIQLLARNLGIPNAVISSALAERLNSELGRVVEVVVSRRGLVQIDRVAEATRPDAQPGEGPDLTIRVDASRLRLEDTKPIPLDAISAEDSGALCGPKAATLGELRKHFGPSVPDGFVLPFGIFRELLERPIEAGGPSVFDWLRERYREIATLEGADRTREVESVLARMRDWITAQEPSAKLRKRVENQLDRLGDGGVFVRSDTNVEDLPGFSGAGLNLTIANVVGVDAVMDAVRKVWASPFTDRAYAWRQAHMARPELVFPSVLVQHAFAGEKSGVMVTADIDTGDPNVLSVAVGEGVGGAVDGQAAESLRIDRSTGRVRQLSASTAPFAVELDPGGGVRRRAVSGRDSLLTPQEVAQLIALRDRIAELPGWTSALTEGRAADVEFAFRDGRLALLQLRPLAESRSARSSERLRAVDEAWRETADLGVRLDEAPSAGSTTATPAAEGSP